ncbi:MAG TPA: winged helix family transcriptional regulator [Candidatus Fraserbacteria bacterium]|nr:winged helix family transcriptional regulator [Candidatus Fraserbacteria bacterium]
MTEVTLERAQAQPREDRAHLGRGRFIGILAGIIVSVLVLDLALVMHISNQQRAQFAKRAEYQVLRSASMIVWYIKQGDTVGLTNLLQYSVIGDQLYAQVVVNGQVIAERLAPKLGHLTLPIEPLPAATAEEHSVHRLFNGESYLDLRLGLTSLTSGGGAQSRRSAPTISYLRVGYSLTSVELALRRSSLFIVGTSTLLLLVIGLLFWLTTRIWGGIHLRPPATAPGLIPEGEQVLTANGGGLASPEPLRQVLELRGGQVTVDRRRKLIAFDGQQVSLSPKEYKLFMQLASDPERIFSDSEILAEVWSANSAATSKDVKQYIYFLRRKLGDDPEAPGFIETVRGHGYKLAI